MIQIMLKIIVIHFKDRIFNPNNSVNTLGQHLEWGRVRVKEEGGLKREIGRGKLMKMEGRSRSGEGIVHTPKNMSSYNIASNN